MQYRQRAEPGFNFDVLRLPSTSIQRLGLKGPP